MLDGAGGAETADTGDRVATFTAHEVLALLELRPGPEAELSRCVLGLPDAGIDELTDAGASTLVARGMYRLGGPDQGPAGAATVVGYAVTGAERWASIAFGSGNTRRVALIVDSPAVSLLMTPRPAGLFDVVPLRDGVTSRDVLVPTVWAFVDGSEPAPVEVTVSDGHGSRYVTLTPDGERWRAVSDHVADGTRQPEQTRPRSRDEIAELLSGIV